MPEDGTLLSKTLSNKSCKVRSFEIINVKGKDIPVTGRGGP
jgi:hypothetical protein